MRKEDCFFLGTITRTHGNSGGLLVKLDTDRPEQYINLESVLLDMRGELVPFFLEEFNHLKENQFQAFFEDIPAGEARQYVGIELFLPQELLPKLSGKQFYFHEVVSFSVIDKNKGEIGKVREVLDRPPQPVFVIEHEEKEILIPAADDILLKIDRSKKEILVDCPEGLLEIYLS